VAYVLYQKSYLITEHIHLSPFPCPVFAPTRKGDVKHSLADIALARELLGYEVGVDFNEGIRRTVAWYLNRQASNLRKE